MHKNGNCRRRGRIASAALAAIPSTCAVDRALAATDTWTNALNTGVWTTNGNWADGSAPINNDMALFPNPGPVSHIVTIPTSSAFLGTVQFDDNYTVNGDRLYLNGSAIAVA